MSGTRLEQVIRYVSAAGDGESWWIRLEQERADETLTVEEAAELIDTLYKTDPCSRGGPDASSDEEPPADPPREDYDDLAAEVMGGACAEASHWIAHVRVYRSHQKPDYVLRSATAEVLSTETGLRESVRQVIENAGNSVDLDYPYAGNLILPPGVSGEVRGSTLNLSRPAGRLVARYTTVYDRVALRVPVPDKAGRNESEEEAARRAALDAAGLIAFWNRLAHAIVLEPPPQDEETDAAELADLCRGKNEGKDKPGDCRRTIEHYRKCDCSDTEMPEGPWNWTEEASAPCPEGAAAGSFLGTTRVCDGYGGCPGEEDELSDGDYYESVCCHRPGKPLPRCRKQYRAYGGGAPIEGGADSWRERYGPDVILTAVAPPDGPCGQEITEWKVEQQNCCDDVEPLSPDPRNPTEITIPGRPYGVMVLGGKNGEPFRWKVAGGIKIWPDGGTEKVVHDRAVSVFFEEGACPDPSVTVTDGCTTLRMVFQGPESDPPRLAETDIEAPSDSTFLIGVESGTGVPPYTLMVTGGLELESHAPDGSSAQIRTPGKFDWCVGSVVFIDACGRQATCTVRNPDTGAWVIVPGSTYDKCAPPGSPFPGRVNETTSGNSDTLPNGGYYARVGTTRASGDGSGAACGPGNNISNQEWKWRQSCDRTFNPSQYDVSFSGGVCTGIRKTTGSVIKYYYYEIALTVHQWVCNG